MNCPFCHAENLDGYSFCSTCGRPFPPTAGSGGLVPQVPDYLAWSILATVFCFAPLGIVAIVYSALTIKDLREGRIAEARRNSAEAGRFLWYSVYVQIAIFAVMAIMMFCCVLIPVVLAIIQS